MTKTTSMLVTIVMALGLAAAPAHAQLSRTFVSAAVGNDANNCDRPTPCRTFQGAHDKTFSDGEITVLDTGGYGAVVITKSISIVSEVGEASILVSGGATGITINAGAAAYINLRGITIQGIGFGGGTGLRFNSGYTFTMTHCVVRNHTGNGIELAPNATSNLPISNTLVADNGRDGISLRPTGSGAVRAVFSRVEMYNNSLSGLDVDGESSSGTVDATATDSVAAGNNFAGFLVFSAGARTRLMMARSTSVNNDTGLFSDKFAPANPVALFVGQSVITGNKTSWTALAPVLSYGDNDINGNNDGDPAPPTIAKK